jgi:8-amino-7-oxononanoate synthase
MSGELRRGGFWGAAIRPPTVPNGTARLRLAFTVAHEDSDIDRLLEIFEAQDAPRRATAH